MSQTNTKAKTNTWNDYIDAMPLIGKFTQNYRYEPKEMFFKHISEELPNTKEIFGFAPLKFFVKGFIQFIGSTLRINLEQLNSDSTYFGSFVGDFTKVAQASYAYYSGWDYGTQKYEWYRPAGDAIKGVCKLSLLASGLGNLHAIRNSACDLTGQAFVDIMTQLHPQVKAIQQDGESYIKVLADVMWENGFTKIYDSINWSANINKVTIGRVLAAKAAVYVTGNIIDITKTTTNYIGSISTTADAAFNLLTTKFAGLSFMPSIADFPKEYLTSAIMMSISRVSAYTPKKLVNMEDANICKALRIIDIYRDKEYAEHKRLYYKTYDEYAKFMNHTNRHTEQNQSAIEEDVILIYDAPFNSYMEPFNNAARSTYNYWSSQFELFAHVLDDTLDSIFSYV
ncbi:hypothetical protein [Candidatus Lariskella endosymbiont of Hedychridium roseum]|uniref:hypothetical protein n=1 Tax=Candidatus Lariskella endosymbiont of Hedychridium roseum TaxID=3077949 RepID=UPI0030CD633A